jgi:hypothetical protein
MAAAGGFGLQKLIAQGLASKDGPASPNGEADKH